VAAANIAWLADEALTRKLTGVDLKDRFADEQPRLGPAPQSGGGPGIEADPTAGVDPGIG
jgi:hypothetical protein